MFQAYVTGHLCDFADYGIEESLDAIQGIGATGVVVAVTSGPRTVLRTRAGEGPQLLRSRGGFYFQPDAEHYADTHLKPIVSSWLRQRNPLDKLVEGCQKRKLDLRPRISALEVGRIAAKHPEAAGKTAFGDASPDTLCPANPDVRALVRATIRDLAERYRPKVIEIEGVFYHSGAFTLHTIVQGAELNDVFANILSTCFSESSRQAASEQGVDASAAQQWAQSAMERALVSGDIQGKRLEEEIWEATDYQAYLDSQERIADRWLDDLRETSGVDLGLIYPVDDLNRVAPTTESIQRMAQVIDESEIESDFAMAEIVEHFEREHGSLDRLVVDLDRRSQFCDEPQAIVAAVQALAEFGVRRVAFSEFGLIAPSQFKVLKQAIRYAARSAS